MSVGDSIQNCGANAALPIGETDHHIAQYLIWPSHKGGARKKIAVRLRPHFFRYSLSTLVEIIACSLYPHVTKLSSFL